MAESFNIPKSDYQQWYPEILRQADIVDDRYPIKGCLVWKGWGYGILRNIMNIVREEVENTGHEEVQFPLMVPEDSFSKESEHIKGFESEVFWVTHAGLNKLDRRLLLRPTSETVMYPMFSLWIRSHNDLPLKIFQVVNVFRYETKHTRPIIRVRELINFYESHTAHPTWEDAEHQVQEDLENMAKIAHRLCISYKLLKRPEWDKFPGAEYTIGVDTLFPDLRTLQIGTVHNLGENFAHPYEITYKAEDGSDKYANQTCYGMSERLVAAIASIHGDDRGLVLPPELAPKQVVIVPILFDKTRDLTLNAAEDLKKELSSVGLKVKLDDRDLRPGEKYYDWELKGVPVRVELGPRDIENNQVVLVRRDTREKQIAPRQDVIKSIKSIFDDISSTMRQKAKDMFTQNTRHAKDTQEAYAILEKHRGLVTVHWCGSEECAQEIETTTNGAAFLGRDMETKNAPKGACAHCGKEHVDLVYLSRKY